MSRLATLGLVLFPAVGVLAACAPQTSEDAETFVSALPVSDAVVVDGPETTTRQEPSSLDAEAPYATYYKWSRKIRDDVNAIIGQVLGSVWYVAHTRPSNLTEDEATWGPYTDSLSPVTYRFRITRSDSGVYRYALEGRPKESTSDDDYRAVIKGTGHGRGDERHGDGEFVVDLDAAKALDPVVHEDDSGTVTVVHELPAKVSTEVRALPRHIEVTVARSDSPVSYGVVSDALEDNTGALVLSANADLDATGKTALESISMSSRWNARGEGRADVSYAGGDVPAALDPVSVVECWDASFKRAYYHDSAGIEADDGSRAACPYADPLE